MPLWPDLFYWLVRGATAMRSGENENKINSFFPILSAAAMKSAKKWKKIKFYFYFYPDRRCISPGILLYFYFFPTADKLRLEFSFFLLFSWFCTS